MLATVPALFLAVMGYHRRWISDDAFINLRVVDHLLAGHGPVFNTLERVEAYTNPLWVALLWLWGHAGGLLEIGAVALSLVFSVAGVLAAQRGAFVLAARLHRHDPRPSLPLGAAVFVAVPVVWDFVTSGLEIGLVLSWLGGVFWLLARSWPMSRSGSRITAFAIGLGPLIRPDLAIFSLAFFVTLLVAARDDPSRSVMRRGLWLLVIAVALPLGYQVFRMGYFAALVPNTALAKEAGLAYWPQGWRYARDFLGTYALWAPLALLAPWWWRLAMRARHDKDWPAAALLFAPVAAALVHWMYIMRVGGDFMHGRLLVPGLFALLLPLATITVSIEWRESWRPWTLCGIGAWTIVCVLWLRVPYPGEIGPWMIADERGFYVRSPASANPIDVADNYFVRTAPALRPTAGSLAINGNQGHELPLQESIARSTPGVLALVNIGALGYAAGVDVHVVDRWGLADPIASRLRLHTRSRPGHEKILPEEWIAARFADPRAAARAYPGSTVAAEALRCGDLGTLLHAVADPLTVRRFLANLRLSWRLSELRIPADPAAARDELCA